MVLNDATNLGVPESNIFYVGKHGNDANSGLTIDAAFLTFGAAISAASSLTPTSVNRFSIVCHDDGIYTEDITTVSFVDVFAPNAALVGQVSASDDVNFKFRSQTVGDGEIAVFKNTGTSTFWYDVDEVTMTASGVGILCVSGIIQSKWKTMFVEDGFGIGDATSASAHMHVQGGDIYITGTGFGIARANSGTTLGHVDHILKIGTGTGLAVYNIDGEMDLSIDYIGTTDGLQVDAGSLNVRVGDINVTGNAFNVTGGTLSLFYNSLTGTRAQTGGTLKLWTPPVDLTDGQLVIGSTGVDPVSANLVSGSGISITNGPGSITISSTGGGLSWSATGASGALVNNTGIVCTSGGALSFSLPVSSSVGDVLSIALDGATSWTVTQGAGQQIRFGSSQTTLTTGSLASTAQGDTITLVCSVANLRWNIISSIGNITIV